MSAQQLAEVLRAVKETLERENENPVGTICDTIWHTPHETLFDFIDSALALHDSQPLITEYVVPEGQLTKDGERLAEAVARRISHFNDGTTKHWEDYRLEAIALIQDREFERLYDSQPPAVQGVPEGWNIDRLTNGEIIVVPPLPGPGGRHVSQDSKPHGDRILFTLCERLLAASPPPPSVAEPAQLSDEEITAILRKAWKNNEHPVDDWDLNGARAILAAARGESKP